MARIKLDEKFVKVLVGENPRYAIAHIQSKYLKKGYVDVKFESELLKVGHIVITVNIPKSELIDQNKVGKIGTYMIKQLRSGKMHDVPILKSMFSKYTTIELVVEKAWQKSESWFWKLGKEGDSQAERPRG